MAGQTLRFDSMPGLRSLDIYELVGQLRPDIDLTPSDTPRDEQGAVRTFYTYDVTELKRSETSARLCRKTEHIDFYLDESLGLTCAAFHGDVTRRIEEDVRWRVIEGFAGDRAAAEQLEIAIVHANLPGLGGYFDSSDLYPRTINQYASGIHTLYLNAADNRAGNPMHPEYANLIAHEFQHALHELSDPDESTWVNEGLSVLAAGKAGLDRRSAYFLNECPPTQVTAWAPTPAEAHCNYAGAGLVMRYILEMYPDQNGALGALVAEDGNSLRGIDDYLTSIGADVDALTVLADWGAANYLNGRSAERYYGEFTANAPVTSALSGGEEASTSVTQFAAGYHDLRLQPGSYAIEFNGSAETPLLAGLSDTRGSFWHAGSEDSTAYSLTRRFDLSGISAEEAVLTLLMRYDTEEDWDYIYLTVSTDNGATWTVVNSSSTEETSDVAYGRVFGPGLTGKSGGGELPEWALEEVDLSPFAGEEILFRILYLTDQAISLDGVSLGGAWLPAADYSWVAIDHPVPASFAAAPADAPPDGGWTADGFFFSNGFVKQDYAVRVLAIDSDGRVSILNAQIDEKGYGELTFDFDFREAAVMVMPFAPYTRLPAEASLSLRPLPEQP